MRLPSTVQLILLFILVTLQTTAFGQDVESFKRGIVRIRAATPEGVQRLGTGFIIRQDRTGLYILTVAHIVEGCQDIQVEFYTLRNQFIPAQVVKMEGGLPTGIALLQVFEQFPIDVTILPLRGSLSLKEKEEVTIIGFPQAARVEWAVITGQIAGQLAREISFAVNLEKGYSGAPLLKDGWVVGIVTQGRGELAYATPALIAEYVLASWGLTREDSVYPKKANLVINGDFSAAWDIGWEKHISPGDQALGSGFEISIRQQQLHLIGNCYFCAVSQSIPIEYGLPELTLSLGLSAKACLGTLENCRREVEGLRYLDNYVIAGVQVEYQDEHEKPLGILRFINTTSGYVVGSALIAPIQPSLTSGIITKTFKIGTNWQTLELDLYDEAVTTLELAPQQVKRLLIAFFLNRAGEDAGFGEVTVGTVKVYYNPK